MSSSDGDAAGARVVAFDIQTKRKTTNINAGTIPTTTPNRAEPRTTSGASTDLNTVAIGCQPASPRSWLHRARSRCNDDVYKIAGLYDTRHPTRCRRPGWYQSEAKDTCWLEPGVPVGRNSGQSMQYAVIHTDHIHQHITHRRPR